MGYLILVRGLPGSGKSTMAKKLLHSDQVDIHFEADMYHMIDGNYDWKPENVPVAHRWCQEETEAALGNGKRVVVSNTFTTLGEMRPYFAIAKKYDIIPAVVVCKGEYGSIHNVPESTMKKMADRFQGSIFCLYEEIGCA